MKTGESIIIHAVFRYILALALCLVILAVFVPLGPSMPGPGLDTSWMMAMNQGVAQRLVFGRDIVFTFGPYASIYTELYHPATDRLMVCGSLFLGLCYALLLLLLGKGIETYKLLLYAIFLVCLVDSRDALLSTYPLLIALFVYRITLPDGNEVNLYLAKPLVFSSALLFAPLGLLPLIKGSLLPICAITAVLCFAILWGHRYKALACLAGISASISSVLFWRLSGQPISALPGFYLSSQQFISGYAEAMSFPGNGRECVLYVLASALIILVIARNVRGPRSSTWFLIISYSLFLFVAFKAGFIRHDPWHNVIAGTSLLAAAVLLMFVVRARPSLLPLAMSVLVWTYIGHGTVQTTADDISQNLRGTFERAFYGTRERLSENGNLQDQYDASNAAIRTEFPVPRMSGTTDIYSFNQSWLLASGNSWAPRPVTQSYAAYTPELAELNLRHLQGANAPDNILFRLEPIDGRLPSLEDELSWPALINGYSMQRLEGQSAYLRKRTMNIRNLGGAQDDLYNGSHEIGADVALPESSDPLFANIDIQPTLLGRVLSALYKLPELHIALRLRDGSILNYRVISSMMKTDFLITPLVKNTEEFVLLAAGGNRYLAGNEVKSITISSEDQKGLFWNKRYAMRLSKLNLLGNTLSENSLLFDKMDDAVPGSLSAPSTQFCEGTIATVNGVPPRSGIPTVGNVLSVQGWMAISGKDGTVPDFVFVTLTSDRGKTIYIKAHRTPRDDVRRHFKQPGMPDPGYLAMIDVTSLSGQYTLGLARTYKENLGICQQFKLPILIAH